MKVVSWLECFHLRGNLLILGIQVSVYVCIESASCIRYHLYLAPFFYIMSIYDVKLYISICYYRISPAVFCVTLGDWWQWWTFSLLDQFWITSKMLLKIIICIEWKFAEQLTYFYLSIFTWTFLTYFQSSNTSDTWNIWRILLILHQKHQYQHLLRQHFSLSAF